MPFDAPYSRSFESDSRTHAGSGGLARGATHCLVIGNAQRKPKRNNEMAGISEAEFKLRISDAKVKAFLILEPLVDLNKNPHESEIKVRAAAAILGACPSIRKITNIHRLIDVV